MSPLDEPASVQARFLQFKLGMYAGGSIFLMAIGAILYWAVNFHFNGVNLHMIGLIFMVIGAIGLLLGFISTATTRTRLP